MWHCPGASLQPKIVRMQCFRQIGIQHVAKLHASGFRQVAILGQVACFRFSASCYTWASCMLQVFGKLLYLGKLHASGFRQVAILGQVACFRFSASCYTWASGMLQVFGKLLYLGKLHASGFRQVAILGQVACFRVISAKSLHLGKLQLQGGYGK